MESNAEGQYTSTKLLLDCANVSAAADEAELSRQSEQAAGPVQEQSAIMCAQEV
jgi:hypothetical protein